MSKTADTQEQSTFNEMLKAVPNGQELQANEARPFLKWVGGKRSILPALTKRVPERYGTYHEVFLGGGALFFALRPAKAYLSDINFHLVLTYKAVRDDLENLVSLLKIHQEKHSRTYFKQAREKLYSEADATRIAALVVYLNKTCFNGVYRVNKTGRFNVPIGSYKDPEIFEEELLRTDARLLQGAELRQHPFQHTPIVREDFYYLDPPYHNTFSGYDGSGFGDEQHRELAQFCKELHAAGAYFMLSNSDTHFVRSLYKGFRIEQVEANRSVSCKGNQRGKENELIIRNYPQ